MSGVTAFPVQVVGESRYQHILEKLCGGRRWEGADLVVAAACVPSVSEAVDVSVTIQGIPVGRLTPADSWVFRMVGLSAPVECRARIRGGWDRGINDMGFFGVTLDAVIPEIPSELARHRGLERSDYRCSVVGAATKFRSAVKDVVAKRMAEKPPAWVPYAMATLMREDGAALPRVRVEIEGRTVGYLGKVHSQRYCSLAEKPDEVPAKIYLVDRVCSIGLNLHLDAR